VRRKGLLQKPAGDGVEDVCAEEVTDLLLEREFDRVLAVLGDKQRAEVVVLGLVARVLELVVALVLLAEEQQPPLLARGCLLLGERLRGAALADGLVWGLILLHSV